MKRLKKFIKEILIVMVGILLALIINNWNEDRKDKNYLNTIMISIENELIESKEDIESTIPKQLALIDTVETYLNDHTVSLIEVILKANGLQEPDVKTNSWRSLANSRIELLEYDKISALSDIEQRKRNLNSRIEKTTDFVLQNLTDTTKQKKMIFRMMTIDAVNAEKRLQSVIDNLLEE